MVNFLFGVGVGLIGGVLFAPKSGVDTREYLRRRADEGTGYVKDRASEMSSAASDIVEKGKQAVKGQATRAQRGFEAMQQS